MITDFFRSRIFLYIVYHILEIGYTSTTYVDMIRSRLNYTYTECSHLAVINNKFSRTNFKNIIKIRWNIFLSPYERIKEMENWFENIKIIDKNSLSSAKRFALRGSICKIFLQPKGVDQNSPRLFELIPTL